MLLFNRIVLRIIFVFFTILISFSACKKQDENKCLKSNGKQTEFVRMLEPFTKLVIKDKINLTIKDDSVNYLKLKTPINLEKYIHTDVVDGVLYISNENKCNWLRSYKIDIDIELSSNSLQIVECKGAGIIKTNAPLEKDYFEINIHDASSTVQLMLKANNSKVQLHNGCSDIYMSGSANNSMVYNAGTGNIYMQNYTTKSTDVRHKGTGQCHVKASDFLTALLEYVGDIHIYGNPANKQMLDNGEGQIIEH